MFLSVETFSNNILSGLHHRSFSSELPYHIVVGMPALSPTMESGTLAEWNVKEGEGFIAGDALAKIETDKASIDFEAQDDGYVAKLLVGDGTQDIAVGSHIMVTVEEKEDVAAFADYVPPEETVSAVEKEEPEKAAPPPAPTPPPPAAPTAVSEAPPPPPPPTPPAAVEEPIAAATIAITTEVPTMGPAWGSMASIASPIAKTLSASQTKYIDLYGSTGQVPL